MKDNNEKLGMTMQDVVKGSYVNSENAKKVSIASFTIAILAFIASTISVYFSYQDSITDEVWQNSQIKLIKQLVNEKTISNKQLLISLQNERNNIQKLEEINKSLLKIIKQKASIIPEANKTQEKNK